jgi:hypothetical protein
MSVNLVSNTIEANKHRSLRENVHFLEINTPSDVTSLHDDIVMANNGSPNWSPKKSSDHVTNDSESIKKFGATILSVYFLRDGDIGRTVLEHFTYAPNNPTKAQSASGVKCQTTDIQPFQTRKSRPRILGDFNALRLAMH